MLVKHIMRLKNTIARNWKMLKLHIEYGKRLSCKKFHFRDNFHIYIEDKGALYIGRNCFFNNNCAITVREYVSIGDNCIFGENVKIYDHNHRFRDVNCLICKQGYISSSVKIDDDCWIGSNVIILKGVHIGKHCVIGAGVIVHKDVPDNTLLVCKQEIIESKVV